ncbi:MAG: glycosyltransferase [Sediminibacterium sp.]|nr:glycosyltransferase [Sediminibacterium sp.]
MLSLIICFYKRIDFLELIFQALSKQSNMNFEVIIAEDDQNNTSLEYLNKSKKKYSYPIFHVSQLDLGFRKTIILNKALKQAQYEKLVFIDGDCIPHKHFIKEYLHTIKPLHFYYGRRVFLSAKLSNKLLTQASFEKLSLFKLIINGCKDVFAGVYLPFKKNRPRANRRILGCNWGCNKSDLLKINGYDEDYLRAGVGEDFDIDWRLKKMGLTLISMKNKAIVYHLHHSANHNNEDKEFVENLLSNKIQKGVVFCPNGILKKG